MSDLFVVRLVAAFVMGGAYVAVMARVAERFGSKLGGLVLALPSTALIGAIFIAVGEGRDGLHEAAAIMPATIGAAVVFLVIFVGAAKRGFVFGYVCATATWASITVPLAALSLDDLRLTAPLGALLLVIGVVAFRRTPHRRATVNRQPWWTHAVRVVVAGSIAAATVLVAHVAGPLWGGVCASFPAVFSASLYLITRAQGANFVASLGRTMTFGCMANVVFAVCLFVFTGTLAAPYAIPLAYGCSLLFAVIAHHLLIDASGRSMGVSNEVELGEVMTAEHARG